METVSSLKISFLTFVNRSTGRLMSHLKFHVGDVLFEMTCVIFTSASETVANVT